MLVSYVREHQLRAEVEVTPPGMIDEEAAFPTHECGDVSRGLGDPRMKDQLIELQNVHLLPSQRSTLPQLWIRVNVVPHLPGSANSVSAARRSEASSPSLRVSSSRDSSAVLN